MKFLPKEHREFKARIDESSFPYSGFSFVKKKGWLSISHVSIDGTFRFHRKDESKLDQQGKWVKWSNYAVEHKSKNLRTDSFEEVLAAFAGWLG